MYLKLLSLCVEYSRCGGTSDTPKLRRIHESHQIHQNMNTPALVSVIIRSARSGLHTPAFSDEQTAPALMTPRHTAQINVIIHYNIFSKLHALDEDCLITAFCESVFHSQTDRESLTRVLMSVHNYNHTV